MSVFTQTKSIAEEGIYPKIILLGKKEIASLIYHDIFDFPLTSSELIKWTVGDKVKLVNIENIKVAVKNGFLFLRDRQNLVLKRLMHKRTSVGKLAIAKKVAKLLSFLPTIKMIAVTGALAMENSNEESDIDFMIITKKGNLWTTRLLTLFLLDILRVPRRKYGEKEQKDKICLNIWLDESDLKWKKGDRNIFTAHEICQIVPLINKEETYERFISVNSWTTDFWPNAVTIEQYTKTNKQKAAEATIFEDLARKLQYWYMKKKITRETVTPTRALFHPVDWADIVSSKLQLYQD